MLSILFSSQLQADQLRFSLGLDYLSGDYSGASKTEISAMTMAMRYKTGRWTAQASIPYLVISGPGVVTIDGVPVSSGSGRTTQKGLGDTTLSLAYMSYYSKADGLGLSIKGKLKLPTADEDKGLGTGERDYSLQLDPFKVYGNTTLFSSLGYKWYGDTSTRDYNNVYFASLGGMYSLNESDSIGLGGSFRQNVTATSDNKKSLFVFASRKFDKDNSLQFHLSKGFGDASPDWGSGLLLKHAF